MSSAGEAPSTAATAPSTTAPTQNSPTVAAAPAPASSSAQATDNLVCQWKNCGERAATPEALYDHVCERHVGRKSTNNLCLVCSWGNCTTSTVKRDHITSHIRVHVPLKPHKCDFCGKSFKRPQDLKKHVKTHADDSVLMRPPHDGAGGARVPNGYGAPMAGQPRPGYYPNGQIPGVPMAYSYPADPAGYYAPTQHGSAATQYANTIYTHGYEAGHQAYGDRKIQGISAINDFFGHIKTRNVDPTSYAAFAPQLVQLHSYNLPLPLHASGPETYAVSHDSHGGVYGPTAHTGQNLPSFSHLRTKADLTMMDEALQQMTQAAYESSHVGAQPTYVPNLAMRNSRSPPSMHMPSIHAGQVASAHSTPPALTPAGSSAVSYTSGHSPTSVHSTMVSPSTTSATYPSLSGATASPTAAMAPVSALGSQYDQDSRRRYSGSLLQRAQPAPEARATDEMEVDSPAAGPSSASAKKHRKHANIDPALAGSPTSSGTSEGTATPGRDDNEQQQWLDNLRLLESMHKLVKGMLERNEYEDENDKDTDRMDEDKEDESTSLYPKLDS